MRVQFPRNQFGLIWNRLNAWVGLYWTVPWSLAWFLVLQIRSSLLALFFGRSQLVFPPKQVSCRFSLNLPLFGLGPSSKGLGTNLKLSTNKIAWIHWSLDLGPSSEVTLRVQNYALKIKVGPYTCMINSHYKLKPTPSWSWKLHSVKYPQFALCKFPWVCYVTFSCVINIPCMKILLM
jgi:hypothetical protein